MLLKKRKSQPGRFHFRTRGHELRALILWTVSWATIAGASFPLEQLKTLWVTWVTLVAVTKTSQRLKASIPDSFTFFFSSDLQTVELEKTEKTTGLIWPRLFCILVRSDGAMATFISAKQHLSAKTAISHRRCSNVKTPQQQGWLALVTVLPFLSFFRLVFNMKIGKRPDLRQKMTRKTGWSGTSCCHKTLPVTSCLKVDQRMWLFVCVCVLRGNRGGSQAGTSDGLKRSERMNHKGGGSRWGATGGQKGGFNPLLLLWSEPIWGPGASFTC